MYKRQITAILPILDDLERAVKTSETSDVVKAMREGIEWIYNKFLKVLNLARLQKLETDGETFDTDYHEAIAIVPAPSEEKKGKILDCVQTGYKLNDKVIRLSLIHIYYFTCKQTARLMSIFTWDDEKMKVLRMISNRIVDSENGKEIIKTLDSLFKQDDARKILGITNQW